MVASSVFSFVYLDDVVVPPAMAADETLAVIFHARLIRVARQFQHLVILVIQEWLQTV